MFDEMVEFETMQASADGDTSRRAWFQKGIVNIGNVIIHGFVQ